eukprot:CAMPEP_0184319148 /NCGR_PEP_ID=MMETSP1049-20130417/106745_1 /TAXON_ID=77928 /ORGANISM="Proteomonas sulcata, Strain CCMP704" /LENGTH=34 /DNA_ID= /DNA_START= /DNA_END= /DNA_ORIENTATION=
MPQPGTISMIPGVALQSEEALEMLEQTSPRERIP